jgi:hypothetical protein
VPLGEALWVTFTKPLGYRHYFADPHSGQVAAFITLMENDYPDYMMLRLRIEDRKIAEIETIMTRNTPRALTMPNFDPMWEEAEPPGKRLTRAELIKGAVGYLTAVAMADGSLAPFSDDCSRTEVGLVSAVGKGRTPHRDGKITRVESTFMGNNVYRAGTSWARGMKGVSRPIGQ